MPTPSRHVELAVYSDNTAIIATSCKPTLLINYPESYVDDIQWWLSEWKIAINISNSTAIIFLRTRQHFFQC